MVNCLLFVDDGDHEYLTRRNAEGSGRASSKIRGSAEENRHWLLRKFKAAFICIAYVTENGNVNDESGGK
jgi:hypothetical protein